MRTLLNHAPTAARLGLGFLFFVMGLNGFLGFLDMPPPSEAGGAFFGALAATGYMLPLIKGTEVVAGLLLLSNRAVPLALVLLAPVAVNIALFHVVLDPAGLGVAAFVVAVELYLAWSYRDAFRGVLALRAQPTRSHAKDERRAHAVAA